MKISALIQRLQELQSEAGDVEVMILDGFNGGGCPRDLNLGPSHGYITPDQAETSADCEARVGETIIIVGFGCY